VLNYHFHFLLSARDNAARLLGFREPVAVHLALHWSNYLGSLSNHVVCNTYADCSLSHQDDVIKHPIIPNLPNLSSPKGILQTCENHLIIFPLQGVMLEYALAAARICDRVVTVEGVRPDVKPTLEGWRATQSHSSTDIATMEKL
jgi:hypothetical protein